MKNLEIEKLNCHKSNNSKVAEVREALYNFSYKNLSGCYENFSDVRAAIFNFFYSGSFKSNLDIKTKEYFKNIISDYLLDQLKESKESKSTGNIQEIKEKLEALPNWDQFYQVFETNWEIIKKCHDKYMSRLINPIKYIVVYEAPPYQKDEAVEDIYFLSSNKGSYATSIINCFGLENNVVDVMIANGVGYFDLILAQMPLSSTIRNKWSKEPQWNIDGKQLPVVLFELGIANLILNGKIIDNPKFAIGTPSKTSTSIFEYYSDKLLKVWKKKDVNELELEHIVFEEPRCLNEYELLFTANLSTINSQTTHKIMGKEGTGEIFPLFKSNVISGSNYLSELLMRNAFDMP